MSWEKRKMKKKIKVSIYISVGYKFLVNDVLLLE